MNSIFLLLLLNGLLILPSPTLSVPNEGLDITTSIEDFEEGGIRFHDVVSGQEFSFDISDIDIYLESGDQIRITGKSGLITEVTLDRIDSMEMKGSKFDVSGTYRSEISGGKGKLDAKLKDPVVIIKQNGDRIEGSFGKYGEIEGRIEGQRISFDWYSSWTTGKGEWNIGQTNNQLSGSWLATHYDDSGSWDLYRIDQLSSEVASSSAFIEAKLISNQTPVRIKLTDIARIEKLRPLTDSVVAEQEQAAEIICQPGDEANEAISRATSAWDKSDYTSSIYTLILDTKAACRGP